MPITDVLTETKNELYTFSLDPAVNTLHSFMLLTMTEERSGLGAWVTSTRNAMSAEDYQRHKLVMIGFYFVLTPDRQWSSFNAYLEHLASRDAREMQQSLMRAYRRLGQNKSGAKDLDIEQALQSADDYLAFLQKGFEDKYLDIELEREAFEYVSQPDRMKQLILSHLQDLWENAFKAEWERVRPMLMDSVEAFRQVRLEQLDKESAIALVTREDQNHEQMKKWMENIENIIFVPSAHIGPYTGRVHHEDTLWVLFGAHIPEGVQVDAPDLSRAELVVRMSALADDGRLRILRLLAERGEMKSQDIQDELGYSQSANSRHLKQLSATGFISERRRGGAKCYQLHRPKLEETLDALSLFLHS